MSLRERRLLKVLIVVSFLLVLATPSWSFEGEDAGEEGNGGVLSLLPDEEFPFEELKAKALVETADQVLIQTSEVKWRRFLGQMLRLPHWLDLGVEHRTRYEALDHPFRKEEFGYDAQILQRTRLRIGVNTDAIGFLVEFQDSRTHLDDAGAFVTNAVVNEADIQQLFVFARARNLFGTGLRTDIHLGWLNLDFGRRRLIARNDFRNTTNSFDGVHWQVARQEVWRIRAFLVEPVDRFTTGADEPNTDALFWGVYGEAVQWPWAKANLYYFGINDRPATVGQQRQYATFGGRLYKSPGIGELDYDAETVWQVGTRSGKDHFAHFQHVEIGYTFADLPWMPRFVALYDYASGTRNPDGSQSERFDTLFGARRFELVPTGIFGPFFRSNISSPGWRVTLRPCPSVRLALKHRVWYLAQARDAWVGSGLQDATGQSGNFLGQDLEVRAQWDPSPNFSVDAGYDHLFKGSFIDNQAKMTGTPSAKDSDYFYVSSRFRF